MTDMDTTKNKDRSTVENIDKTTILIVEDSRTQALLLQQLLQKNGFIVHNVNSARSAIEWLETNKPTMVISDVVMPEMDGYELCQEIKANPLTQQIPVLLLTKLTEPEDIVRGLECGADRFVTKPFDNVLLLDQVNNILLNQQLRTNSPSDEGLEVYFGGKHHVINSARAQILDLLLSTYESSLQQKRQLEQTNLQLNEALEVIRSRNREIAELAIRDPLTKLFNRGYFNDTFPDVIKRAQRYNQQLALIMCDIDYFKNINDQYGHQVGDMVLIRFAQAVEQRLRNGSDWIARFGGEEFVIVLPETDSAGAQQLAELLLKLIESLRIECGDETITLTASFGVAICAAVKSGEPTLNSMVKIADRCLYQAKAQGRNCCCSEQI